MSVFAFIMSCYCNCEAVLWLQDERIFILGGLFLAFIFCHVIGVYCMFGLLDCVRYNKDFVISTMKMTCYCSVENLEGNKGLTFISHTLARGWKQHDQ